jgi:hypothetical protein
MRLGFYLIRNSLIPTQVEAADQAYLDWEWKELKQGHQEVRFYREIPVRGLHIVMSPDSPHFASHSLLRFQAAEVFDGGVREHYIERPIAIITQIGRVTSNRMKVGQVDGLQDDIQQSDLIGMILSDSHAFPKYLFSADIQDVNGTRQVANKLQEYLETLQAEG